MRHEDVPKLNRRGFLTAAGGVGLIASGLAAAAAPKAPAATDSLRGSIAATDVGLVPGALDDQSRAFQRLLDRSAEAQQPVFLPPGDYRVSNIRLPTSLRLSGVPGATRIVYGGDGHLFMATEGDHLELSGLTLDGGNRWMADYVQGLVDVRNIRRLVIDNCSIAGSAGHGLALERCSGRVERTAISGAAEAGLFSVEAGRMSILGNTVGDCANGGILVQRWTQAEDLTIVSGNRVERIAARRGGTGQFGNGINTFRADKVSVIGNVVADCAFSAIRANSCSDVSISGNTCLRSGETAIYSEFAFQGAVIASNVVDGAANGISIVNFDKGGRLATCTGNVVRNLSRVGPYPADQPGFGVGITVEADTTVSGNTIENAPLYGMKIGWGPFLRNVVATGNVIGGCPVGIAVTVVDGAGPAIVTDNVIGDAGDGAVVGYRWSEAVTSDMALAGSADYPHLTVERNHVG